MLFVVLVFSLLRDFGNEYFLTTDWVNIEMRTCDVFRHEPLIGFYFRAGWSHFGLLLFELLALLYRMTGGLSVGLFIGAALISAAATMGATLVARNIRNTSLLVCTLIG